MEVRVSLTGDAAVKRALSDPQLVAGPLKTLFTEAALFVEAGAKEMAPVDTGRLRSSITTEIAPLRARAYTNVFYTPFVEFGTRPHFPPPRALQPWARRHGFASAWPLARAIAARGTRPHPYMRPAAERLKARLPELLRNLAKDIESLFNRKAKGG